MMKKQQWATELFTYLLALLFLYTASSKLFDFRHFVSSLNRQPFDDAYTPYLSQIIPGAELLAVILLLITPTRRIGLWLSLFLMAVFTGYVALVTFHFYARVPCACAGVFQKLGWPQHLLFNIFFTGFAAIALRMDDRYPNK